MLLRWGLAPLVAETILPSCEQALATLMADEWLRHVSEAI